MCTITKSYDNGRPYVLVLKVDILFANQRLGKCGLFIMLVIRI